MECNICINKKIYFFKCDECKKAYCFTCFKKCVKCPFCRNEYTLNIILLKYIININSYYKNINKMKSIEKKKRKKRRLNKRLHDLN